ncbi:MAG: thrombospondin type 3 repeat-containing protein [Planctomycetota bacterium]
MPKRRFSDAPACCVVQTPTAFESRNMAAPALDTSVSRPGSAMPPYAAYRKGLIMNRTTTFFSWCGCLGIVLLAALPTPCVLADSCPPAWTPGFGLPGMNDYVWALTIFDDGTGPALYAGGWFTTAGVPANYIAKWNPSAPGQWSALGSGMNFYVRAFTVFDDGTGPALYAGGDFTLAGGVWAPFIAKWNGTQWSALGSGSGMNNWVFALTVFDDGTGPALYAGGEFTTAGGVTANWIAKWNGTQWSALDSGMNNVVRALTVFDDGTGPALYAGGYFGTAGGVPANGIAKWNGTQWSALGSGMNAVVIALTVFDDGSGPALYAGGGFTTAGGETANYIAKWNGTQWLALGSGMNSYVYALTVFDDGTGPALYAGGMFTTAGAVPANRIAKWNGTKWSSLGSGMNEWVFALTVFDDGTGPALYAGGDFTTAGGIPSSRIARWGCQTSPTDQDGDGIPNESDNCPEHYNPSQADCDGDGIGDACQPGATDCNGNDIPDDCDVTAGTSLDCNGNGVPDECEWDDFDGDGDVDLLDYQVFEGCITGPCVSPPCDPPLYAGFPEPCCGIGDSDRDGAIDLGDFAGFQSVFTGSP